jgi:DNA-binding NarL/FixJ family response regulator
MPEANGTDPKVGLIGANKSVTTRIRKILKTAGFPLVYDLRPEEVDGRKPSRPADVIVISGALRTGPGSSFRRLLDSLPSGRIVACTLPAHSPSIRWAIDKGVDGLVWETRMEETLALTIRAVHADQLVIPRDARRRLQPPQLTSREKQSLSLIIMGLSNKEIAEKLYVSESTVKSHLNSAFRKLGVHSRAEAARLIADPDEGLGTGILAITNSGHAKRRKA